MLWHELQNHKDDGNNIAICRRLLLLSDIKYSNAPPVSLVLPQSSKIPLVKRLLSQSSLIDKKKEQKKVMHFRLVDICINIELLQQNHILLINQIRDLHFTEYKNTKTEKIKTLESTLKLQLINNHFHLR